MKLWILRPRVEPWDDRKWDDRITPWSGRYDRSFGFVVRAETEEIARRVVATSRERGDEDPRDYYGNHPENSVWSDPNRTSCEVLGTDGETGIIMRDFLNG